MGIFEMIDCLADDEIGEVVVAVLRRYNELFPDWEIATVSINKKEDREEQLNNTIRFLENLKTSR